MPFKKSSLTTKAFEFAKKAHSGQNRYSGEPFINHPIEVVNNLKKWGIKDETLLAAALLHDTMEDVHWVTKASLKKQFGQEVSDLVEGVSKFKSRNGEVSYARTLRKIITKSYIDPRVAVLKLADRLHNMQTLEAIPTHKQTKKAHETLDIYSRLAESLGMWIVKRDLEDLAFQYTNPKAYQEIKAEVDSDPRLSPAFLKSWTGKIKKVLAMKNYKGHVDSRINGYWTLAKKRERAARLGKAKPDSFGEINDLVSFRVIMNSIEECYCFIGNLHREFGNVVDYSRFDEFMGANARDNGYNALQTTLMTPFGAIEIAITTAEFELFNNWGVVALISKGEKFNQYALKLVFTPTQEIRFLPRRATGIDFAYAVNPRLGADARGILVNNRRLPLSTVIPNAATVTILTGKTRRAPHPSSLHFCLPGTAKIIREQLNLARRDTLIIKGRKRLEKILSPLGILEPEDLGDNLTRLLYWYGCRSIGDLSFKVGGGYLLPSAIHDWFTMENITREKLGVNTIKLSGQDKPGILLDVTNWINSAKGNIVRLTSQVSKGKFEMKVVVEGLTQKDKQALTQKISKDTRFTAWNLV